MIFIQELSWIKEIGILYKMLIDTHTHIDMDNYKDRAFAYEETVRPYLESIRDHIDHLEMEVDDEIWPLPKYRELLFTK